MAKKDQEQAQGQEQQEDVSAEEMVAGVQEKVDQEQEQGYVGTAVDETPNDAYTVSGVASGAETPETTRRDAGAEEGGGGDEEG